MSEGTKHAAGTPSWADLGTTDAEAATAFYSNVFGWETEKTSAGPAGDYVLCRLDGALVAGLYEQDQAMKQRGCRRCRWATAPAPVCGGAPPPARRRAGAW